MLRLRCLADRHESGRGQSRRCPTCSWQSLARWMVRYMSTLLWTRPLRYMTRLPLLKPRAEVILNWFRS